MRRRKGKPEILQFRPLQICPVKLPSAIQKHLAVLWATEWALSYTDAIPATAELILDLAPVAEPTVADAPTDIPQSSAIELVHSWIVKLAQFRDFQRWIPRRKDSCPAIGRPKLWAANIAQKLCPNDTCCLLTNALDAKFHARSPDANAADLAVGAFKQHMSSRVNL